MSGLLPFSAADQVSLWALNVLIHATIVMLLSLAIGRCYRKRAAMRYWVLCCGLLLVLASPVGSALIQATGGSWLNFSISAETLASESTVAPPLESENPIALIASDNRQSREPWEATPITMLADPQNSQSFVSPTETIVAAERDPVAPVQAEAAYSLEATQTPPLQSVIRWIGPPVVCVWFFGACLLSGRMLIGWLRMASILRHARPMTNASFLQAFDCACETMNWSPTGRGRPKLVVSDRVSGPIAAGIFRGKVVLPESLVQRVQVTELCDVLIHEAAHIARRDQVIVLLQNLVAALFWLHPLVRVFNRELAKAREEVCDNFVLAATDAPSYSRTLLTLAELVNRPKAIPGSVGFFTSRWKLEQRIADLLDASRDRATVLSKRGWLFVAGTTLCLALPMCIGTITIANASGQEEPAETGVAGETDEDTFVSGVVLKPDGSPVAGATVRSAAAVYGDMVGLLGRDYRTPLSEAVTDDRGRFRIRIESKPYGDLPVEGTKWKDFWKKTRIAASMPGFGSQWVKYEDVEHPDELKLQLVDDVPIRGRVIDLEGNRIGGANIEINDIRASKNENLDAWLKAIGNGEPAWTAVKHAGREIDARLLGIPERMTTDDDGTFEIRGLGRERLVSLRVHGNGVAFDSLRAVTREMKPVTWNAGGHFGTPSTVYGAKMTHAGRPSRTIAGQVVDADSGEPLSGVDVAIDKLAGENVSGYWLLETKTNSDGRFKIDGAPKGDGNRLLFRPSDDQCYFMREIEAPNPDGIEPVQMQVKLHRGIWIEGKVVDKQTREPVAGVRMHYLPLRTNEFAQAVPEFDDGGNVDGQQSRYQTDAEGRYRLVGLPGAAIVGARSIDKPFRNGVGYDRLTVPKDERGRVATYRNPLTPGPKWPDAMIEINPAADARRLRLDVELDPGGKIAVSVVDEDGNWLKDATLQASRSGWSHRLTIGEAPVEVTNLAPDETRAIIVYDEQRRLGLVRKTSLADCPEGVLKLTALPCGKVMGRLTRDGEPLTGVSIRPDILPTGDFSPSLPTVTTDEDGRFQSPLLAGCKYKLRMEGKSIGFAFLDTELTFSPGETIDLGTLALGKDRKFVSENKNKNATARTAPVTVKLQGKVVGPEGKPMTATLWVGGPGRSERWLTEPIAVHWRSVGQADADGRFEITLPKVLLDASPDRKQPVKVRLAATAAGLGFAWVDVDVNEAKQPLTLQLVHDKPIEGRMLTVEGRPAAGVQLAVVSVVAPAPEELPDSEAMIKNAAFGSGIYTNWPAWRCGSPTSKPVVTDADGRFRLSGLGGERHVRLEANGGDIGATRLSVLTRLPPNDATNGMIAVRKGLAESKYFARFTHVAVPARSIRGIIKDKDTRKPIGGVQVVAMTSWASRERPSVTDSKGQFAIDGVPKDDNYRLELTPDDAVYFRKRTDVSDSTNADALDIDLSLSKGIEIRGRVIDAETGKGVPGSVVYNALFPNEQIESIGDELVANPLSQTQTDNDGSFAIAVLPGPGALAVRVVGGNYASAFVDGEKLKQLFGGVKLAARPNDLGQYTYLPTAAGGQAGGIMGVSIYQGLELLKVSPDESISDLTVKLIRKPSRPGAVFGPAGKPLIGVEIIGLGATGTSVTPAPLETNEFTIEGLLPGRTRTLLFLHRERSLGARIVVDGNDTEPAEAKLTPTGTVTGRFIDSFGEPLVDIELEFIPLNPTITGTDFWSSDVDEKGGFRFNHLIEGISYMLHARIPSQRMALFVRGDIKVESGESIDLGTFKLTDKKEFVDAKSNMKVKR